VPLSSKSKSKETIRKLTLKTEAVHASETLTKFYQTIQCNIPEDVTTGTTSNRTGYMRRGSHVGEY
jgi:hypothetical protein